MTTKAKPQDHTGRERDRLSKEHADEQQARAEEMSMISAAQKRQDETEVVDLTHNTAQPNVTVLDEVEDQGVSLADEHEVIQVVDDIDQMTFGVGNHLSFKAGKKYKVTKAVADHLREKNYVWGA